MVGGGDPSFFAMAFSDERVTVGRIQGEQGASGVAGWGMESTPKGRPGCRWNLPPRLLATGPRALESSGQVILKTWISENLKCWQVPRIPAFQGDCRCFRTFPIWGWQGLIHRY